MAQKSFVIGVDFGTDTVRSVIVDAKNGREIASAVEQYKRWTAGRYCDPARNQFRQHPLDYAEGLEKTVTRALAAAPKGTAAAVRGLSVDTTGSTPCAVDKNGIPLAMQPAFKDNPNAMFILWKDHTAVREAEQINTHAKTWGGADYTQYSGGVYSSEWFWSKILHVLRADAAVRSAAFSWVEHCDWIPALLSGHTDPLAVQRSRCAAGHKAMWHASFDGLPSEAFLAGLDPVLAGLRGRLYRQTVTADVPVGTLSAEWAKRLRLHTGVVVGAGAFDAHMGAVGVEIAPYILSKVMGTSTCDMLVAPDEDMRGKLIRGICGQVDGSILPGMLGMEAGQSAFGDVYAWFNRVLLWPAERLIRQTRWVGDRTKAALLSEIRDKTLPHLSRAAQAVSPDDSGIIAIDWMNGRRTPYANQALQGALTGLALGSDAPKIFRALVEATAFGAKKIVDRFMDEGVKINGVIALGGIPKKSPFIMQIVCNVLGMPIRVAKAEQACALGAAMFAAVAAGIHPTVEQAQKAMGNGFSKEYRPDPAVAGKYALLYNRYSKLGDFIEREMTA